ncbi:MAG: phosphotransferase [Candidatus Dormibacteria bacterium]
MAFNESGGAGPVSAAVEVLARFGLVDSEARLREYLPRQRWFGGRDREIRGLSVVDVGVVQQGDPAILSVIVDVEYADGEHERYHVPVAAQVEGAAGVWEGMVIGEGERDGRPAVVYDALHGGEPSFAFWKAIAAGVDIPMESGRLVCRNAGFELGDAGPGSVRPLGREQSNSSLVRGDLEVMKCFRKLAGGVSPELEMLEALDAAGFTAVAAPLGVIEYDDGGEPGTLVAMLQPYLHNGTDGWTLALASLRDLYGHAEDMGTAERREPERVAHEQGASFEAEAERMARVTALMHLALRDAAGEALRAEPVSARTLERWSDDMIADLDHLVATAGARVEGLPAARERIAVAFRSIASIGDAGVSIRYHGDYHLGQLLRTDGGWTILDFEGEPARGAATRRARSSPLRDVAGMMRSFDYAAAVEMRSWAQPGDAEYPQVLAYGQAWSRVNREAFWRAYLEEVAGKGLIPEGDDAALLRRAFELQKAVYEVGYEVGHRPELVEIPLNFLLQEEDRG